MVPLRLRLAAPKVWTNLLQTDGLDGPIRANPLADSRESLIRNGKAAQEKVLGRDIPRTSGRIIAVYLGGRPDPKTFTPSLEPQRSARNKVFCTDVLDLKVQTSTAREVS